MGFDYTAKLDLRVKKEGWVFKHKDFVKVVDSGKEPVKDDSSALGLANIAISLRNKREKDKGNSKQKEFDVKDASINDESRPFQKTICTQDSDCKNNGKCINVPNKRTNVSETRKRCDCTGLEFSG